VKILWGQFRADVSVLKDVQKVARTVGYKTALNIRTGKYVVIEPDGNVISGRAWTTRIGAIQTALAMARITFARQDAGNMMEKAKMVLGNDVIDEIGEEHIFDGPLYQYEEESQNEAEE